MMAGEEIDSPEKSSRITKNLLTIFVQLVDFLPVTLKNHFSQKDSQAFSLVEMLVVISVIGIIASLAVPNLTTIRNRAYSSKDERNAQTVASLIAAARSAGVTNQWHTVEAAIDDLEDTLRVKVGGSEMTFSLPEFSPEQRAGLTNYLAVNTNTATVYYTGPAAN